MNLDLNAYYWKKKNINELNSFKEERISKMNQKQKSNKKFQRFLTQLKHSKKKKWPYSQKLRFEYLGKNCYF